MAPRFGSASLEETLLPLVCVENNSNDHNDDDGAPSDTLQTQPNVTPREEEELVHEGLFSVYLLSSLGETHCIRSWGKHCTGVCVCVCKMGVCLCISTAMCASSLAAAVITSLSDVAIEVEKNLASYLDQAGKAIEGLRQRPRPLLTGADL